MHAFTKADYEQTIADGFFELKWTGIPKNNPKAMNYQTYAMGKADLMWKPAELYDEITVQRLREVMNAVK